MTIAALQYAALRRARFEARSVHGFSQRDEADWSAGMDIFWQQMTLEEQQAEEDRTGSPESTS